MKSLIVLYRHSNQPIEIKLEDAIADQLYMDIYNARLNGKTTLRINSKQVSRFINPSEIIDCMVFPVE